MSNHLTFRPVTQTEYPLNAAFKRQTFLANMGTEPPFSLEEPYYEVLRRCQSISPETVVFALLGHTIIGNVEVATRTDAPPNYGFVYNYFLLPQYRGQGLGNQLDAYATAFCRRLGFTHMRLRTHGGNAKVMRFYTNLGWKYQAESEDGQVFLIKKVPSGT